VHPGVATSARNVFPARIVSMSSMGFFLKIGLDCGFRLVSYVTPESFTRLHLEEGKDVFASFKATAVHVVAREEHGKADRG
jgi:tungstate transport system ATP-binding protein